MGVQRTASELRRRVGVAGEAAATGVDVAAAVDACGAAVTCGRGTQTAVRAS
jgi:hypothetical protein